MFDGVKHLFEVVETQKDHREQFSELPLVLRKCHLGENGVSDRLIKVGVTTKFSRAMRADCVAPRHQILDMPLLDV